MNQPTSSATSVCQAARNDIFPLRYDEDRPDTNLSFFPLNDLRKYLSNKRVGEILGCDCDTCMEDRSAFGTPDHIRPINWQSRIVGQGGSTRDTLRTAYSLFSLLICIHHPILIIGFLEHEKTDWWLEKNPESFKKADLKKYTRHYFTNNPHGFDRFAAEFETYRPQFAVRHMDSGTFSRYPPGTILPFINEKEIGKQKDQSGQWTNIGANGRVFSFEIHSEYRKFEHAREVKKFARKMVETSRFTEHLERANLESAQSYKDDHIVKLIHAYSLGGVMNLIFPLAATNLDQLLRNPIDRYRDARVGRLESCNAWTQLLGIARALAKIAGTPTNVAPTGLPTESRAQQWIGFHFDLKPANILVSEIGDSGTWLITDFGQSSFTFTSEQTPRARNDGGTDAYAPPEIIHNQEKQFSRRYDVWSLGCLALEVAAFVVLGYDGLTGPSGLDEVRQLHDGWSRLTDSRFWYRRSENAAPEVKPSITKFMTHLSNSARNLDKRSRKFLTEVLKLIERMLQPAVQHRIEIGEVIRILEATITQASKRDDEGQLLQTVPGPDERDIGAPELGQVQLRHWNRISEQWQDSVLRVFEDRKGNLRFYSVAHNRYPSEITLHRQNDAILPYYAFWEHEIPQGSESWLGFCSLDPKGVPEHLSLLYGFERLLDSRFVQSRLTYQNIEKSFSLSNVQIHKYVKIGRKVINVFARTFKSKEPHDVTQSNRLNEETHLDGRDLGPATIQLWTEEEDPGAVERQENESVMSRTASTARKHKIQIPQQQGDRSVLTRRAVIYLHRYKCIITIKIGVNWIARISSENPKVMHFQPTKPDRDPHFVTSLIQPANGKVAGLPLCPQVLRQIEGQHQFEADRITLHFGIDSQPLELNGKYRLMKQSWEQEKGEVQKLPRDTPARAPHSSQESLSQVPPRDSTRVLGNYAQASMSSYVNKGKGRATRPSTVHEGNEDHNGYTYDVPQPYQNGGNGCLSLQSTQSLSLDWHPTLDPSLRQQFPEATPNGNLSTRPSPYTPRPSATQTVGMTQRQAESSGTGIQARQRDEKQYEKSGISSIESVATDGPIRGGRKRNRAKGGGER